MTPDREELRSHLVRTRIAGTVATPRESNVHNYRRMAARDPYYLFGMSFRGAWGFSDVLDLMAERVGVSPDPDHVAGTDTIDPDRTIAALEGMAARLARAAAHAQRVMLATGHPVGLLPVYIAVGAWLAEHGCQVLTPAAGWTYDVVTGSGCRPRSIRYVEGVATVSADGALHHTHDPDPMEAMLAELAARGEQPPDLVVADHGWAGAAGEAGVDTVGFADCNDPALFVGEAEGKITVSVPLDDNVAPHLYDPLIGFLLGHARTRR